MSVQISLIVLSGSSRDGALDRFLKSVIAQAIEPCEVIIIGEKNTVTFRYQKAFVRQNSQNKLTFVPSVHGALDQALTIALGDYVAICNSNIRLRPNALREIQIAINGNSPAALYCFERLLDDANKVVGTIEKPKWSPVRFRQNSFIGHFVLFKSDFCLHFGGFGDKDVQVSIYEMMLKVSELSDNIFCIEAPLVDYFPSVVDTSIEKKREVWRGRLEAVEGHLFRQGLIHAVNFSDTFPLLKYSRPVDIKTSTSVIIPTRGSTATVYGKERVLVLEAVRSVIHKSSHQNYEFIVVADKDTPLSILEDLRSIHEARVKIVTYDKPFNFSEKCNIGALNASGEILVFLNDDVEIESNNFLEKLVAPLEEPVIGQVGIMMFFEDGTIQHAGHAYSHGQFMHIYSGKQRVEIDARTPLLSMDREVSGLTAACVAVRKSDFNEIGGFCEFLPGNFNDVDFSLKIRQIRKNSLILHELSMVHFESKSRVTTVKPGEVEFLRERWGYLNFDPYFTQDIGMEDGY